MEEVEVELKPQKTERIRGRSRQGTAFQTEGKLGEERREMRRFSY